MSSMFDTNFKSSASSIIVEKILEQGQRLRNSMVQAILNNDPFNQEILHNHNHNQNQNLNHNHNHKHVTSNVANVERKPSKLKCTCKNINDEIDKYLCRDNLFLNQELEALETNRSTSPVDFLRSASSVNVCHCKSVCGICREYETKLISHSATASVCSNGDSSIIVATTRQQAVQTKTPSRVNSTHEKTLKLCEENETLKPQRIPKTPRDTTSLSKYVDSLKINIYSLKLNKAGHRKILAYTGTSKYPVSPFTYFIEYTLPEFLAKDTQKPKSRINTGLKQEKSVRYCTKIVDYDCVYFKQQKIHSVSNIHQLDLQTINIKFNVSFRSAKQRTSLKIGKANFNLGSLIANRYLSCEQELVLMNENAPVVLGAIKISVQLGCDKLYFGKEFIDAISCSKENTNLSESDSIHKEINVSNKAKPLINKDIVPLYNIYTQEQHIAQIHLKETKSEPESKIEYNSNDEINLLYALIFISEVQFTSGRIDSFIICKGFSREDTVTSRTILNECNPNFNLYQIIPILIDENYVNRFRDNYILVEVWEQKTRDQLLGICKLPIHQFYVAYRNALIVKYLTRSPHPVISVDWWEPIINPNTNIEVGQLRSIVALGTQSQVLNLEQNRNIKDSFEKNLRFCESNNTEKCMNTPVTTARASINNDLTIRIDDTQIESTNFESNNTIPQTSREECLLEINNEPPTVTVSSKETEIIDIYPTNSTILSSKVDASTQFEETSNTKMSSNNQRELLNNFLEQLICMPQQRNQTETSTNTDECITNMKNTTTSATSIKNDNESSENAPYTENITISNETFPIENNTNTNTNSNTTNSNSNFVRHTSELLDSLQKALGNKNEINKTNIDETSIVDRFKVHVLIESALHLPSRKKCKSKRSKTNKTSKQNEEILPSTYVTFKCLSDDINITPVVPKSTSPKWDYRNDIYLPTELLLNNQKRLIFKVWRKANGPNLQPNFQTDIVLGFAALDLTVLLSGLPNVQGWFNIVDFSSKCNGQIKIHVNPLENLTKFINYKKCLTPEKQKAETQTVSRNQLSLKCPTDSQQTQNDVPDDLMPSASDSLSRALKRKFTELDEITQRLRQRLCAVTNDDFDEANDIFEDEFERDLNTICDDEDFVIEDEPSTIQNTQNTIQPSCSHVPYDSIESARSTTTSILSAINAAKEISQQESEGSTVSIESSVAKAAETSTYKSIGKLDNHLNEGKLKIDALLEKLTLLTHDPSEHTKTNLSFTSRYVSGCSESSHSAVNATNNMDSNLVFNPNLFQEIFARNPTLDETQPVEYSTLDNLVHDVASSGSEVEVGSTSNVDLQLEIESESSSSINTSRQAPDGAGNMSNESRP